MTRIAAGLFFWLGALGFGAMAQATGPGGLRTLKVGAVARNVVVSPALAARLASKPRANMTRFRQSLSVRNNRLFLEVAPGRFRRLERRYEVLRPDEFEARVGFNGLVRAIAPAEVAPYAAYYRNQPNPPRVPPDRVSLKDRQTPIRDQRDRGTCVAFATTAALEAAYSKRFDLSEQALFQAYKATAGSHECADNAYNPYMVQVLKNVGTTLEHLLPYKTAVALGCPKVKAEVTAPEGATNIGQWFEGPLPEMSPPNVAHRAWRVTSFSYSSSNADPEVHAKNPRYLEALLATGREVIMALGVSDWTNLGKGIVDVKLGEDGKPLPRVGGHAMLLVGYRRLSADNGLFVFKNSWGQWSGHDGYAVFTYDYIRTYATDLARIDGVLESARGISPDWRPGGQMPVGPVSANAPAHVPQNGPVAATVASTLPNLATGPVISSMLAAPQPVVDAALEALFAAQAPASAWRHPTNDFNLYAEDCVLNWYRRDSSPGSTSAPSYIVEANAIQLVPPSAAQQAARPLLLRARCRDGGACARNYGTGPGPVSEFEFALQPKSGVSGWQLVHKVQQALTACRNRWGNSLVR